MPAGAEFAVAEEVDRVLTLLDEEYMLAGSLKGLFVILDNHEALDVLLNSCRTRTRPRSDRPTSRNSRASPSPCPLS